MIDLSYIPEPVVDIATLTREQWLECRKKGIGGSDVATLLGISKWKCPEELYLEKLGYKTEETEEPDKQFLFDCGHAMEPVLESYFERLMDCRIIHDTTMYRHPDYPFMLADFDSQAYLNGEHIGLEFKTTHRMNISSWHSGTLGEDGLVPSYYETQARHYMAVANLDVWYFVCAYGFTEADTFVVRVDRDLDIEEDLIAAEKEFWEGHVLKKVPVSTGFIPDSSIKRIRLMMSDMEKLREKKASFGKKKEEPVVLDSELFGNAAEEYLRLCEEKKSAEKTVKEKSEQLNSVSLKFTEQLGDRTRAVVKLSDGRNAYINYPLSERTTADTAKLKKCYPDIWDEVKKTSASRTFSVETDAGEGE